jgi:ribosomal protein S8E
MWWERQKEGIKKKGKEREREREKRSVVASRNPVHVIIGQIAMRTNEL